MRMDDRSFPHPHILAIFLRSGKLGGEKIAKAEETLFSSVLSFFSFASSRNAGLRLHERNQEENG